MGVTVGPGVGVEAGVAGEAAVVGEATPGVKNAVGNTVCGWAAVALGVASATEVGAGPPDSCDASNTPASTVATETRPTTMPLSN